jgi:hypothetical protein
MIFQHFQFSEFLGHFQFTVNFGNSENATTIVNNSRSFDNFSVILLFILDAGLRSRIMTKKLRLTENPKHRRVEITEENIKFLDEIWRKTIQF